MLASAANTSVYCIVDLYFVQMGVISYDLLEGVTKEGGTAWNERMCVCLKE